MEVTLTADQNRLIRQAIEDGRLRRPEDAVAEAFALWEERERKRGALLASLDAAQSSLVGDEDEPVTPEAMRRLATDIKRRGRDRLAAELQSRR